MSERGATLRGACAKQNYRPNTALFSRSRREDGMQLLTRQRKAVNRLVAHLEEALPNASAEIASDGTLSRELATWAADVYLTVTLVSERDPPSPTAVRSW